MNVDKKIGRNRVFDWHLLPDWHQMGIEKLFLANFDARSSIVEHFFDCRLSGVVMISIFNDPIVNKTSLTRYFCRLPITFANSLDPD